MSLVAAHARLFSMDLLNGVPLLLDGEWLELRSTLFCVWCMMGTVGRMVFPNFFVCMWEERAEFAWSVSFK